MARLLVIAVAGRLPNWAESACAEYLKRMPRGYEARRLAVKPEPRGAGRQPAQLRVARPCPRDCVCDRMLRVQAKEHDAGSEDQAEYHRSRPVARRF